jgi:HAD superfamily hydrolase (TIGR01509 family)
MVGEAERRRDPGAASRPGLAAVLFDWDGTLSDSRHVLLEAWHASTELVLGRRYPDSAADEDVVFTLSGAEIWPAISRDPDQARRLAEAFQDAYATSSESLRAFRGVVAMLQGVRRHGVATAVVTSKGRERFVPDAERTGLGDLIDVAVCAGEAAASKPDPSPLLAALARLDVAPDSAAMVGDTVVDVAAGVAAGTWTIGVDWGHGTADQLLGAGAQAVATTPAQLCELLLNSAAGERGA